MARKCSRSSSLRQTDVFSESDTSVELVCSPADAQFADLTLQQLKKDALQQAGKRVREGLDSQPAIQQAIKHAISQAKQANTPFPIYFLLREKTEAVEPLPWETLWDEHESFLALDQRWPIGRMSGGQIGTVTTRTFSPPIRILAFLCATGIQAQGEWDALYGALAAATLPVHLRVYICEPDLETHIKQRVVAPHISVDVAFMSAPFDFATLIPNADHTPHIIHFFCHGTTDDGPTLLMATKADWENGESSIAIGPEEFARIPGMERPPWLITLNCCKSGTPHEDTRSFARQLATDHRIPAVVAMREAVAVEAANVFCAAFYAALLREIGPSFTNGAGAVAIEWAKILIDPRLAVARAFAGRKSYRPPPPASRSGRYR